MCEKSKQLKLENNSSEEKPKQRSNESSNETNEWLRRLRDEMTEEEYIRLNYKSIIDSLLNKLDSIEDKLNEQLFNNLLEVLLKTLSYNRAHPSPQRNFNFNDNIEKLVNKLSINTENLINSQLNDQNLLIKIIKYSIKDSNSDNYSNELVIEITQKFLSFLKSLKLAINSKLNHNLMIGLNNLILNTMRCIYLLINNFKYNIITRDLNQFCGELLGVLKLYSFYGIPGYDMSKIRFTAIYPSHISQYVPIDSRAQDLRSRKGSINRKSKHKKNKSNFKEKDLEDFNENYYPNSTSVKTSDSEFSSSDYDNNSLISRVDDVRIEKSIANKIRLLSYECLSCAIDLFDKRVIFGFWSSFIPDSCGPLTTQFSTLSTILRDPLARVRASALSFLYKLLLTGDQFVMTLADETSNKSTKQLSFTPLSQSLAAMISEIHNNFYLILFGETNASVLIQAFKCLSLLITISPYNKLKTGLLTDLFYKMLFMLSHKDIQIQNACLALTVKIFELDPIPEELKQWIVSSDGTQTTNKLFDTCIDFILNPQSILLCGESLKLFTTVLRQQPIVEVVMKTEAINISIEQFMNIAIDCLSNEMSVNNQVIQNLICKYLFAIGSVLKNKSFSAEEEFNLKLKNWWIFVLKSQLITNSLNNDNSIPQSSQCVVIDFLSTINSEVFESFETKQKYYLISLLLSIARNEENISSQSASIRCLSVFQSFKSMIEDLSYLFDVSYIALEVIQNFMTKYNDKKLSISLLYQSSWTLANFCDILKKFYCDNSNDITVLYLFSIIDCVIIGFDINIIGIQGENIRTNLVRCAGSALYLIIKREEREPTLDLLTDVNNKYTNIMLDSIQKLINCLKTSKSFKLQWNVCNVFSYLLENQFFIELCKSLRIKSDLEKSCKSDYLLIDCIFDTLITVMKTSRNHKVQSYAVYAICSPIECYFSGQSLKDLWISITVFMIENYDSVPLNIRQNWFEKFCSAINKLIVNCFDCETRSDIKVKETIDQLIDFLTNDMFVMSCGQQNSDIVESLKENLNK